MALRAARVPPASSGRPRPLCVAATAGVRMGDRICEGTLSEARAIIRREAHAARCDDHARASCAGRVRAVLRAKYFAPRLAGRAPSTVHHHPVAQRGPSPRPPACPPM